MSEESVPLKPRAHLLDRSELESISGLLAEKVLERLEKAFGGSLEEVSVSVRFDEEWPYTVEVEASVRTKYPFKGIDAVVQKALDEAISEIEEVWKSRDRRLV
jgi:hypothetical protein